ncbi:hypothetical protein CJEDD_10225 [Corynebacterium jeddahense]|uniref:Uncharacterized protein n=1 Tax=Corynebacterium jeddahense TaxID=1414719 RepID=A0ABY7UP98_9CORY|nr:hypothetical protein CJEDD_10225 [Corynebacterium jeddahense]
MWVSGFVSLLAIAFPYLFPSIFPDGTLPYYMITISLGIAAGIFAYRAGSGWLITPAGIVALSPLLAMGAVWGALRTKSSSPV